MGHYGCKDLLSILSSVYSAFFTVCTEYLPISGVFGDGGGDDNDNVDDERWWTCR